MNLYYKMLRMKSRKRKRKMRGGGIFGPVFSSHIDTAGNQASQGLNKVLSGWDTTKKVGRQEMTNFRVAHNENLRSGAQGGNPPLSTPPLPTTPPPSITTIRKQHRPVLYSRTKDPLTLLREAGEQKGTTIIDKYKGGRKTKKRRRKRKKKKTKRKKRRRKRKTKKRKRRR